MWLILIIPVFKPVDLDWYNHLSPRGDLPYKKSDRGANRKIKIKPLRDTNVGVAKA